MGNDSPDNSTNGFQPTINGITPIPAHLLDGLNPEQIVAVQALFGPVVIIAGPGSGKTKVLTHRIAALVATGSAHPSQILAVTFTNKAAGEMKERVTALLGEEISRSMWICTFHSFCARLLRIEAEQAGLPRAYSILDPSDVRTLLRGITTDMGLPNDSATIKAFSGLISRIKNGVNIRADQTTLKVMEAYQLKLARLGSLDFDDLLLRAAELLRDNDAVRAKYQHRFTHVLVDEYQDTNPVQYQIVGLLSSKHRNICVVGDGDQSIYGFRSASPEALQTFADDWPGGQIVILEENYRSSAAILETCQAIIDQNHAVMRPRLRTANATGAPVRLVVCSDDRDESRFIAKEVQITTKKGSTAVLMRTNAQTRSLEDALLQEGIPYTVIGALRFYDRSEIKDTLAYLRLIVNPLDVLALNRVVANPKRGIGAVSVDKLVDFAAGGNLLEALARGVEQETLGRGGTNWATLLSALNTIVDAIDHEGPVGAVKAILDSGVRDHVKRHGGETTTDRLENLDELVNAAAEYSNNHKLGTVDDTGEIINHRRLTELFIEQIALVSGSDEVDETTGGVVQLLTAHSSKGKEFDSVYVVGVEENLFPHGRNGIIGDEDEERRLLFVACSRARHHLTLTRASRRYVHGNVHENQPSRFLADLPGSVVVSQREQAWQDAPHRGYQKGWKGRPGAGDESWKQPHWQPPKKLERPAITPVGPRLQAEQVNIGDEVCHLTFGDGKITAIQGTEPETVITIMFTTGIARQFKLAIAPLTLR